MAKRTFRKKKQQQSRFFFGVIFYVYTNVDNRERERERELERVFENKGDEFRGKKNINFKASVRKREMLAASKVKIRGNEK